MKHKAPLLLLITTLFISAFTVQAQVTAKGAELKLLADGFKFTEGPAKSPSGAIYFTDQPNNRILKWDVKTETLSTFLEPSGRSNGLYFDNEGLLVSCADANNQMWRIDAEGNETVLIDSLDGHLLNAPNDLWIDELGGIYFTDPLYKRPYWNRDTFYLENQKVYYRTPQGEITSVVDDYVRPNGIIGDIKNGKLFIADIGDKKVWAYDIVAPGQLGNKTLFAPMASDGMTLDSKRNLYLTSRKGVYVFNSRGEQIELIEVPQKWTANVTIGGKKNKTLYITAVSGFYAIDLKYKGLY